LSSSVLGMQQQWGRYTDVEGAVRRLSWPQCTIQMIQTNHHQLGNWGT
jgi:hypothetical protein